MRLCWGWESESVVWLLQSKGKKRPCWICGLLWLDGYGFHIFPLIPLLKGQQKKKYANEAVCLSVPSLLVKAWNYSSWPAYKSRLWNKEAQDLAHKP